MRTFGKLLFLQQIVNWVHHSATLLPSVRSVVTMHMQWCQLIYCTNTAERARVCVPWVGGREGGSRVGGWVTAQPQRHKNSSHQSRSLAQGHMQINWPAAAAAGSPAKYNGRSSTPLLLFCPPKPKRHISITWIRQLIALQQVTEVVKALNFGQWKSSVYSMRILKPGLLIFTVRLMCFIDTTIFKHWQ